MSDLTYVVKDGNVEITDCKHTANGTLIISVTISGYAVTSIGNAAFFNYYNLKDIEIPSGRTSFGYQVLNNTAFCLDSLNWVDDVLYIDEYLLEAKFKIPSP